jgi:geranylgeranyl pyrophosphate synthase
MIGDFSRNLGVAFQILNDLKDWDGDDDNKLLAGQDVLSARPTLLLALALEAANAAEKEELLALLAHGKGNESLVTLERVRRIFTRCQVFDKAEKMVEKFRAKAEAIADETEPVELRELLYYLVDTVLDRTHESPEIPVEAGLPLPLVPAQAT